MMKAIDRKDCIIGAVYGVAVGDALGAPLEFMSAKEIKHRYGRVKEMIGGGWLSVDPGETTDDTAMMLAVAEGIIERPEDPIPPIGERFLDWAKSGPKDIGGTCARSINVAAAFAGIQHSRRPTREEWFRASALTAKESYHYNAGNGALMRSVYPAVYYTDREKVRQITRDVAQMTHYNELSTGTCELYADIIYLMCQTVEEERMSFTDLLDLLRGTDYDMTEMDGLQLKPSGYVVDSMVCALYCLLNSGSFADAVESAANLGGDADTIAAITGGLAGAFYGYADIPSCWISALSEQDRSRLNCVAIAAEKNNRSVGGWKKERRGGRSRAVPEERK